MSKKIKKKEKHITNLQNTIKRALEGKESIIKKKEQLSKALLAEEHKMEEETKTLSKEEVAQKLEEM